ncbi:MAG TPA: hypothetical protein PK280_02630 [Planctomycetota bacterium]|nr:hypothetical protein [Planctomycetota bacterium]
MKKLPLCICAILVNAALAAEPPAPPTFAKKPTATKSADGKVRIEFAVDRETDVSVFIVDSGGRVVRHLVSGVLGKNPPAPLAPGLAQSVEWDGKADWGKPATGGPFKVRVALGLGAKYDKAAMADPQSIEGVHAMAVWSDGGLCVLTEAGGKTANRSGKRLVVLNRDGSYRKTLSPPPAGLSREHWAALGGAAVELDGRTVPVVMDIVERRLSGIRPCGGALAAAPEGQLLFLEDGGVMGLLDGSGKQGLPPAVLGPKLLPKEPDASFLNLQRSVVAASGDGKAAYFSGIAKRRSWSSDKVPPYPAVFRVRLPERSPAEPFFGDPAKAGADEAHLGGAASAMAADGKGTLFVADPANKRIVAVSEADGKSAASFPAGEVVDLAADGGTGAVYLLRRVGDGVASLVKMGPSAGSGPGGWKDPKELATAQLTASSKWAGWRMALDAGAKPPVVWASDGARLLRIEDLGTKFSDARQVGASTIGDGGFMGLVVDRWRADPEVYARTGWHTASANYAFMRYSEKDDRCEQVSLPIHVNAGSCLEPGPDGNLYTLGWPQYLYKWDRSGKPVKWDAPFASPPGMKPDGRQGSNGIGVHVCMVYMTHTHGIRHDGHHFVFESPSVERGPKKLVEFLPSGERVAGSPLIWKVSDVAVGPKFDQAGNIYVAEQIRPKDEPVPAEFAAYIGTGKSFGRNDPRGNPQQMWGSIVKFSPKGGTFDWPPIGAGSTQNSLVPKPYEGEPKLDPELKTVDAACFVGNDERIHGPAKVTGALWMHYGISHIENFYCNCESTRFDVDEFGRVWYPDLVRCRVGVLDTNGNPVTRFGTYGNADSTGPEIAFAWLSGVGVTDRYAYAADGLNRRVLRIRIVYAAEDTAVVP